MLYAFTSGKTIWCLAPVPRSCNAWFSKLAAGGFSNHLHWLSPSFKVLHKNMFKVTQDRNKTHSKMGSKWHRTETSFTRSSLPTQPWIPFQHHTSHSKGHSHPVLTLICLFLVGPSQPMCMTSISQCDWYMTFLGWQWTMACWAHVMHKAQWYVYWTQSWGQTVCVPCEMSQNCRLVTDLRTDHTRGAPKSHLFSSQQESRCLHPFLLCSVRNPFNPGLRGLLASQQLPVTQRTCGW